MDPVSLRLHLAEAIIELLDPRTPTGAPPQRHLECLQRTLRDLRRAHHCQCLRQVQRAYQCSQYAGARTLLQALEQTQRDEAAFDAWVEARRASLWPADASV